MKPKPRRVAIPIRNEWEAQPVRIVSDALIATVGVGEGRLIPLIIIETKDRPDVDELVRVHEHLHDGEVNVNWGPVQRGPLRGTGEKIALRLRFFRPTEVLLILEFDIARQGGIVDNILASMALYLQPGQNGDRLSNTLDAKKILIEVPETGFGEMWNDIFYRGLVKDFRGNGLSRNRAKEAALEFMKLWRGIGRRRIGGPG